jgi:NAD(P)-dependent dehydrogenase (short-subunit alcohol dehydrogenase family)
VTRVAVVTGGSGALGTAVSKRFTADGFTVISGDLETSVDITKEMDVETLFDEASRLGDVAAVVLAAGVWSRGSVADLAVAEWERVVRVNLTGSFLCARAAARRMPPGPGSIVFVSSQAGLKGEADWGAYSASKFGVIGLMQSLARELTPRGVRVNAVCPGSVDSPMLAASSDDLEAQRAKIPVGRFADPAEIATAAAFLCSPEASYISGASLVIDGGELS